MEKTKEKNYKTHVGVDAYIDPNKGITLIALIITIIILLILAAIVINLSIGQRGLLKRAEEAGRNYQEAARDEDEMLRDLLNYDGSEKPEEVQGGEVYAKMYTNAEGKEVLVLSSRADYVEASSGLTLKEDYGDVGNKKYEVKLEVHWVGNDGYSTMVGTIPPWLHEYVEDYEKYKGTFYANENLAEVKIVDKISPISTSGWFCLCTALTNLDLTNLDTSNVTNMSSMFCGSNLTILDLSNLDTSNVTNMSSMFYGSNLTTLDLSNLDTSNVINMNRMFARMYGTNDIRFKQS